MLGFYVMCIFLGRTAYKTMIYISYISTYFMNYSKSLEITRNHFSHPNQQSTEVFIKITSSKKIFSKFFT